MDLKSKLATKSSKHIILNVSITIIILGLLSFLGDTFNLSSIAIHLIITFFLIFSAIFCSGKLHLTLVILITFAIWISMPIGASNIVRASIFSLLLVPITSFLPNFPKVYITATLWFVFSVVLSTSPILIDTLFLPSNEFLFTNAVFEIVAVLLLSLLRSQSFISSLFGAPEKRMSAKSYVVQMSVLTILIAFFFTCIIVSLLANVSLTDIAILRSCSLTHLLIMSTIFIILPILLSFFFTNPLVRFTKQVKGFIEEPPSGPIHPITSSSVTEFNDLQDYLKSKFTNYQSKIQNTEHDLKTLRDNISQRELQAQKREQIGINLQYLLNKVPCGCIALTTSGIIIEANDVFRNSLCLGSIDLYEKKYTIITSEHPWAEEIMGILHWACKEHKSLIGQGSFRFYSSSVEQRYLEIEVYTKQAGANEGSALKGSQLEDRSQVGVVLFFQIHPDIRDFLTNPLKPTRDLILEKYALQVCEEIKEHLVKITDDLSEQKKLVIGARTAESFDNLRLLAQDIDKLTHESLTTINRLTQESKPTDDFKTINLTNYIQDCLNHLYDLMSLGRRIQLKDGSVSRGNEKPSVLFSADSIKPPPPIFAEGSASKLANFSLYFLSLIKYILPITTKIDIYLATEHIGSGTATILPTTTIGDFARIYIRHAGQSVTPNMTLRTLAEICSIQRQLTSIEIAVSMLMWQVKDLGGFVTMQSSAARGTHITIYLPLNQRGHAEIERKRSGIRPTDFRVPYHRTEGSLPYVLLISPDTEELSTFKRMIIHLGYHVTIDHPGEYLAKEDEPIGFGGLGFSDSINSQTETLEKSKRTVDSPFDIILVNTNKAFPVNIKSLKQIEEKTPKTQIIVLVNSQETIGGELNKYNILLKPFDLDDLKKVLEEATIKKMESTPTYSES